MTADNKLQLQVNDDKIVLRRDWDYSPHIDENFGYHVIRKNEQAYLVDFLYRRNEGALLLSGKRGVGKTSAIFSAIHEAHKKLKDDKINDVVLPILVNAPNFESFKEDIKNNDENKQKEQKENEAQKPTKLAEFKRTVLQHLIRRLYEEGIKKGKIEKELEKQQDEIDIQKENFNHRQPYFFKFGRQQEEQELEERQNQINKKREVMKNISTLFNRAVAKEVRRETNAEELHNLKDRVEREAIINLRGTEKLLTIAVSLVLSVIIALHPIPHHENWSTYIALVTGIVPAAVITLSWERKKNITTETEERNKSSTYYLFDYNVGTLQAELEETLSSLASTGCKVIFVIDELDKMSPDDVIDVVKVLKTLFNQSGALFIIITAGDLFEKIVQSGKERGKEYTLFSQKVFLQRPIFSDIKTFMDRIVEPTVAQSGEKDLFSWEEVPVDRDISLKELLRYKSIDAKELDMLVKSRIIFRKTEDGNSIHIMTGNQSILVTSNYATPVNISITVQDGTDWRDHEFVIRKKDNDQLYICTKNKKYIIFQYYSSFASKSDFFDLYNIIRDHIEDYAMGRPKLNIKLSAEQIFKAKLQKAMEQVYSLKQYNHPSDWEKNESLLDIMYNLLVRLSNSEPEKTVFNIYPDPYLIIIFSTELSERSDVIEIRDKIESSALMDLILYLTRLHSIEKTTSNTYRITGSIDEVPDKADFYFQDEKNFLEEYEKYRRLVLIYSQLLKDTLDDEIIPSFDIDNFDEDLIFDKILKQKAGIDLGSFNSLIKPVYENLRPPSPRQHYSREELKSPITEIYKAYSHVLQRSMSLLKTIFNGQKRQIKLEQLSPRVLQGKTGIEIPREIDPVTVMLFELDSATGNNTSLLIAQDAPDDVYDEIRRVIGLHPNLYVILLHATTQDSTLVPGQVGKFSQMQRRSSGLDVLDYLLSISRGQRQNNNNPSANISDIDIYDETLLKSFLFKISSLNYSKVFSSEISPAYRYRQFIDYLNNIKLQNRDIINVYVEQTALLAENRTWFITDEEILQKYPSTPKSATAIINEFLAGINEWCLLVGATFGNGKSSLCKTIAYRCANNYPLEVNTTVLDNTTHIPVFVYMRDYPNTQYRGESVSHVIETIVTDQSNPDSSKRNILLILDGLEEYSGEVKDVRDELLSFHREYPNMKFIMTARIFNDIPSSVGIPFDYYLRLLPFTEDQINDFFNKQRVPVTYNDVTKLGLQKKDIEKPLLSWMFAALVKSNRIPEADLGWSENMKRAYMYMLYIHSIVMGKYNEDISAGESELKKIYNKEIIILRRIAGLKQIYGDSLDINKISNDLVEQFDLIEPFDLKSQFRAILESYFTLPNNDAHNKSIDFQQQSLGDYLLAEYYIESILSGDIRLMDTPMPKNETIFFLDGLIDLLISESLNNLNNRANQEIKLSFNVKEQTVDEVKRIIIRNTSKAIEDNYLGRLNYKDEIIKGKVSRRVKSLTKKATAQFTSEDSDAFVFKWISLYILNKVIGDDKKNSKLINRQQVSKLIILSSNEVPHYIKKLRKIDLSESNLSKANLSMADLSSSDLSKANLSMADLSSSDLSKANLSMADLSNGNLSKANLSHAYITNSLFRECDLSGADLSFSDLSYANLEGANLTNCRLHGVRMLGIRNFEKTIVNGADFEDASIDNYDLIVFLRSHEAKNAPNSKHI